MRTFIAFLLMLFNLLLAEAQVNLVANSSFEDTVFCPIVFDNMQDVQVWSSFGNSADYFNVRSITMNAPYNTLSFESSFGTCILWSHKLFERKFHFRYKKSLTKLAINIFQNQPLS